MRNVKLAAGALAVVVGAAALAVAVVERDAGAQVPRAVVVGPAQKALVVSGTDQNNQAINTTDGAIQEVRVNAHAGGPYSVFIHAVAGDCQMTFASANDAAEMAARVQDPKTTSVWCQGAIVTVPNNFIALHKVGSATDITINGAP